MTVLLLSKVEPSRVFMKKVWRSWACDLSFVCDWNVCLWLKFLTSCLHHGRSFQSDSWNKKRCHFLNLSKSEAWQTWKSSVCWLVLQIKTQSLWPTLTLEGCQGMPRGTNWRNQKFSKEKICTDSSFKKKVKHKITSRVFGKSVKFEMSSYKFMLKNLNESLKLQDFYKNLNSELFMKVFGKKNW